MNSWILKPRLGSATTFIRKIETRKRNTKACAHDLQNERRRCMWTISGQKCNLFYPFIKEYELPTWMPWLTWSVRCLESETTGCRERCAHGVPVSFTVFRSYSLSPGMPLMITLRERKIQRLNTWLAVAWSNYDHRRCRSHKLIRLSDSL